MELIVLLGTEAHSLNRITGTIGKPMAIKAWILIIGITICSSGLNDIGSLQEFVNTYIIGS